MSIDFLKSAACVAVLVLAGCATTPLPTLSSSHPASPQAVEGSSGVVSSLGEDAMTQQTEALLRSSESSEPAAMSGMHH
ncbi:MAG: hypothetical protein IAE94_06430 [Chthoniobacterales bacterium]|nr:hypothetical protein [Chthoniobacterales bacterium]